MGDRVVVNKPKQNEGSCTLGCKATWDANGEEEYQS
jgi:hypothetical protein